MIRRFCLTVAVLLPGWLPVAAAQGQGIAVHELGFAAGHNQYVHVRSRWPVDSATLELALPSWTPGSYLIRDFAAHVEGLAARAADGRELPVRKVAKNRWRVDTAGADELIVDYDVWAGELNVATSWVEGDMALLNGAGLFLYNERFRDWPQRVSLDLPASWAGVHTPLRPTGRDGEYEARDYDELVDSPIVAGTFSRHEFRVRGQPYALILGDGDGGWDVETSRADLARLVEAQQDFWGVNPFDREYLFINLFMGPFGGLEHDHATVLMVDPWQMRDRDGYRKWLGLASHEFFHAWNVRRLRPSALHRYDYDRETYTRELWLAEGLSSYYDDLLLFRAGLIEVAEYFDLLAQEIRNYESLPGRQVRSAERASFDTWIKQYRPDENSVNSTVSYYRKGALIGFVTDTAIRRASRSSESLDTVLRGMYRRFGPGGEIAGGYPPGAFEEAVERAAGPEVRRFVEDMLRTTADPDVDAALEWYGLTLDRRPGESAGPDSEGALPADFGVIWDASGPRLLADQVILGRAAAEAGMLPGDELLAIDGLRVGPTDYLGRLQRLRPGQQVDLTVVRHQRLMNLPVVMQQAIADRYVIVTQERISRAQKDRLSAWLGRELRFVR